jgi:hypothetical protein
MDPRIRIHPKMSWIRNPAHRSALQAHAQLGRICDQHEDEWDFLLDVMRVSKGKKKSVSDPSFQVNPDPDPVQIQGCNDQKMKKKKYSRKFFISFLTKNFNLLWSKLQEKPSALKENIEHLKNEIY